jgi:DNA topoisomerase IA
MASKRRRPRRREAIAWHIAHVLGADPKKTSVSFHEITEHAILAAMENPTYNRP